MPSPRICDGGAVVQWLAHLHGNPEILHVFDLASGQTRNFEWALRSSYSIEYQRKSHVTVKVAGAVLTTRPTVCLLVYETMNASII